MLSSILFSTSERFQKLSEQNQKRKNIHIDDVHKQKYAINFENHLKFTKYLKYHELSNVHIQHCF